MMTMLSKSKKTISVYLKKKTAKDLHLINEWKYETYPYKPDIIKYDGKIFDLNAKLNSVVSFEDGYYVINNEVLDITVWGESRAEVEYAFCFAFKSLYDNYANEDDSTLTEDAIALKNVLRSLIKGIYDEN